MAWIELHQSLPTHRKTLAAADALDMAPVHLVGHLISFWLWALDNVPDGELDSISPRMIAYAAQWTGEPKQFLDALIGAGFIDERVDGSLSIHDWYDYAGKLVERRQADRQRARQNRAVSNEQNGQQASTRRPTDVQRTSNGQTPDVQQTSVGTVPYSTVPNRTKPKDVKTYTSSKKKFADDSDEMRLTGELIERIQNNNPTAKVPTTQAAKQSWAKVFDLMMRVDKRPIEDIRAVIAYSQLDKFWSSNILSARKLREKYDTLWMQMPKNRPKVVNLPTGPPDPEDEVQRSIREIRERRRLQNGYNDTG
jgi:hypothetical protein